MRNDERLRTIYEVMAPYIVRNEHNWRDYLAFASQFHKHSFDNILLVYAQDEDVSILATRKQWAAIGRNLIPRAKGVAVCVYRNAKLTLDYLFDVSQTTGKEIHPTDWQLSDEMKEALTERLSYAHGFPKQGFSQALYALASESVADNYNHFLQELKQETKGHLFTEIPAGGFEAQYIQLLTDSISYFIGKKCHLADEEIQLSDGMATVSHFNTLPLVAHLGTAVTALSKGILLEVERNIKIINRERMVDEAHFFKNCFVFTKLRNVAGITTSSSQRAFDMLLKCQYLQETNQGRGVVFATGTPISNSISELFVMQRYLQPQELERFGWSYFDTWIAHFAKRTSVLELKPEGGGYRMRDRFVRFYNLPELMAVFREVADIKTADMLDIPGLPAVRTGKAEIVSVEATPAQQAIMADFIMRAEAIRTGRVKPEEDNMLKLTGEARLMAIDPRLIRPDADGTGSKLSVCIEDVYQVWKDTAASASTQLVFCDVGTPKAGKFNVYNEIRNVLLAKGVPESEIAFVHDATSEAQRQELFERTRQGKVRILIGSTSKLGTGVNVQNKVISIRCEFSPDFTRGNAGMVFYSLNLDTAGTGGKSAGPCRAVWDGGFLCRKISEYLAGWG